MSPGSTPAEADGGRRRPRVGYLGPAGTFSEEALLAGVRADSVEPVPVRTIYEAILALRRDEVELAIVPIENSLDGSLSVTLDLLADDLQPALQIVGEELLTVRHSLITAQRVELIEIDTVSTHPQVPGQCERFLRGELAHARVLAASSTAEAVRATVEAGRRDEAALGTVLAAEIYGGVVLREGVQDRDDNETRFAWVARSDDSDAVAASVLRAEREREPWKTSLVFWGPGADSPGWLVRCLERVQPAGDQPDQDRVATQARAHGALHVLRQPAGQRARCACRAGAGRAAGDLRSGARARRLPRGRSTLGRRRFWRLSGTLRR